MSFENSFFYFPFHSFLFSSSDFSMSFSGDFVSSLFIRESSPLFSSIVSISLSVTVSSFGGSFLVSLGIREAIPPVQNVRARVKTIK